VAHDYEDRPRGRRSWDVDDDNDEPAAGRRWEDLPHSGLGIASFILGLSAVCLFLALLILAIAAENRPRYYRDDTLEAILGLLSCGLGLITLVGGGLGIGGVCQSRRRKVFGIIGLCLNGVFLLGILLLIFVGLTLFAGHH
jgi:hypothetical protein